MADQSWDERPSNKNVKQENSQRPHNARTYFSPCGHYKLKSRTEIDEECEAALGEHNLLAEQSAHPMAALLANNSEIVQTKFETDFDGIATERKLQEAAAAAEDALVESLGFACSLIEVRMQAQDGEKGGCRSRPFGQKGRQPRTPRSSGAPKKASQVCLPTPKKRIADETLHMNRNLASDS